MKVTIHTAKIHLSKLIEAALAGEEVVIAKGGTPVVKLVPIEKQRFKLGLLADKLTDPPPDFLEPMSEDELLLWEGVALSDSLLDA